MNGFSFGLSEQRTWEVQDNAEAKEAELRFKKIAGLAQRGGNPFSRRGMERKWITI